MKAGWSTGTLVSVSTEFTDGDWIETKDQSDAGIRLVQTGNVGVGDFKDRRDKARFIDEATFQRLNCFEVLPDDCLISRLPKPVGRGCRVPQTGDKMITAVDCSVVRIDPSKILPKLFLFYLQSHDYFALVEADCSGTTRKRISRKKLEAIPIPIPPLEEQKRIVAVLDAAFAGLARAAEHAEANLQNARELFESFANSVVDDALRGYPIASLADLSTNLDRQRVPITKSARTPGPIPYYGASGVVDHVADHLFDEDLLLISEDGANLLARTYPIAFSISGRSWVNNHAHVLRFDSASKQAFVSLYLNAISLDPFVSGMAQPKLNQKALNAIPIPEIPEDQCRSIVKEANNLNAKVEALEADYHSKLTDIADLRQSLLQKAFAGELT